LKKLNLSFYHELSYEVTIQKTIYKFYNFHQSEEAQATLQSPHSVQTFQNRPDSSGITNCDGKRFEWLGNKNG